MGINSPDYRAMARQKAAKYGVDPAIFERQINQESGFQTDRVSPAGATGIAQIMTQYHPGVDATDPEASLDYAARLMAGYLRQYGGDYRLALASYNAGAGSVAQYGGVPPYQETQTYVASILGDKGAQEGKMAGPVDDINAQLKKLQEQIDKAERDAESADIDVSYPAQKRLVALNKEYRQLLSTAVSANKRPTDSSNLDVVRDPRTQQPIKYRDPVTGQLIDLPDKVAPQMYVNRQRSDPGDSMSGPSQWNERVPVVDTRMNGRQLWGLPEGGTQYELIQTFPGATSNDDPLGYANLSQRQAELAWKQLWEPQKTQMDNATSLYGNMANNLIQAVPYMVRPGQEYDTGFEPGGIGEKWAQRNNQTYNPDMFRVNRVNYNPDDIMAQAWKMAAAGVPKPQGVK